MGVKPDVNPPRRSQGGWAQENGVALRGSIAYAGRASLWANVQGEIVVVERIVLIYNIDAQED